MGKKKFDYHGYTELYNYNGKLLLRGKWIYDTKIGYHEWHNTKQINYFIR